MLFRSLAAFASFSGIASLNKVYYLILAVFNIAVWLCMEKCGVKQGTTLMALAYASIAVLYAVSIGLMQDLYRFFAGKICMGRESGSQCAAV